MSIYPSETMSIVEFTKVIAHRDRKIQLDDRLSSRLSKCAGSLNDGNFIGWMMNIPVDGMIQMQLFGSNEISRNDLRWIAENAVSSECERNVASPQLYPYLYELVLPANRSAERRMGFGTDNAMSGHDQGFQIWPMAYSSQFSELVRAFREKGAIYRATLGPCSPSEQQECENRLLKNWNSRSVDFNEYTGTPVKARFFLNLPEHPTIRIKTVLSAAIPGTRLQYIGNMDDEKIREAWLHPLNAASVLPDYAARILLMEPIVKKTVIGIEICDEPVPDVPVRHENTKTERAIVIGKATGTSGQSRDVSIGEADLRRHVEIIGQTGTGKSTLLAKMILQAIQNDYPCTFLDPHGSTIDLVLHNVPEKYADRIRVVRIGDCEHPVPLNYWDSGDPYKEERNISDLCELFGDLFDPHNEGFVGPRYERWLSTFSKASLALLGRRASLESIAVLSQSKDNMLKLSKAIIHDYPDLVQTIAEEYGKDNSNEFNATLSWYLCKFQRLTSVEQLRKTLGAGTNALNFQDNVDKNVVTLIDLASPEIGPQAARIIGTLILVKLWNAIMTRKDRSRTHLLFLDEAQIYCRTNPLPRMLAESRKFGLSICLCHQHEGQLTPQVRESLEANSANLISFRLSPKDAATTSLRLDDGTTKINLSRLDAYKAITSLSVDGMQTAPFTLNIEHISANAQGESTARMIERKSIEKLVTPYTHLRALTPREINDILKGKSIPEASVTTSIAKKPDSPSEIPQKRVEPEPEWLANWRKRGTN